ncbi:MAG TPA: hypothetical protein PLZ15_07735 [Melioribacteraceae bacterium]|nr:hypothetical protein [Melioribacteraceae bacterium]
MEDEIYINQNNNITRLQRYLNYEVSGTVLYFFSFFAFVFIFFAAATAIIFTPYMLYVLYSEKKKGWIILFAAIVIVPVIFLLLFTVIAEFSNILLFITLGLFYFYCFLLRFEVNDWVREARARSQYLIDKQKREKETELFLNQFK